MTFAFHPVADIFPMMSATEFDALKADIAANGQLEPIWLHTDGSILDGRNRYLACCDLDLNPITHTYAGPLDTASLVQFVVSLNLKRRHLDSGQKAFIALEVERVLAEAARERQFTAGEYGHLGGRGKTLDQKTDQGFERAPQAAAQAAMIVGTNRQYVSDAKRITEHAPDLAQAVKNGDIKLPDAKRALKKRVTEERRQAVREIIDTIPVVESEPGPSSNTISRCRIEDLHLPAASVDMIFTDPPYHDEYIELYAKLTDLADHVLKPGGYVMAYVGKMFLPDVIRLMSTKLEYVSIFAVFQPFSKSRIMKHNIFENWRPIIAFKKPGRTETKEWVQDVVRGNRDKDHHDWQQDSEAPMQYIAAYTEPGDIVLDPFCGGGTTPAACKELGRFFLAFDADSEAVKTTIWRLNGNTSIPQS